jgi:hypothetical protein
MKFYGNYLMMWGWCEDWESMKKGNNLRFCEFFEFFENRDFARLAPEKCEYLGNGSMDFGSGSGFGNIIRFYLDLENTNEDWMSKYWPTKFTEGENVMTLVKN